MSRNDGSAVSTTEMNRIIGEAWSRFGGAQIEGPVTGHWIDPIDGTHYEDLCLRLTVVTDRERLSEAIQTVENIGKQLDQKAMYFEIQGYDGVQFLRID
jgi:hypothetical protein